jgi:hypothetical protein
VQHVNQKDVADYQDKCFTTSAKEDGKEGEGETSKEMAGDHNRPLGLLLERKMMI